jgi:hypothetical protein
MNDRSLREARAFTSRSQRAPKSRKAGASSEVDLEVETIHRHGLADSLEVLDHVH